MGAVGRVVAVTAVAIATGRKLEKGKRRSLKSRQGRERPAIQELLTPNPLDLILPLAALKFALSLRSSVLPAPATGARTAMGSPGPAGDIAASFPGSRPCEARGAIGSCWLRGLRRVPGSDLVSGISLQSQWRSWAVP